MEKSEIDIDIKSELKKIDSDNNKQHSAKKPLKDTIPLNTGAIQKKKSSLKSIKTSNSLKSSDNDPPSNLVKMGHLGKSAPSLNARSLKDSSSDCPVVMRRIHHQAAIRSPAVHRISFTSCLSPRSESPVSPRPPDSPRIINSPSANHFQFMPFKRLSANKIQDNCRRWSIVSLPSSSGYGTPGSSNISSQCSSQERLHQFPHAPTDTELRLLNNRFSGNESSGRMHPVIQKQQSHPLSQNTTSHPQSLRKSFHQVSSNSSFQNSSTTPPLNSSDTSNEGSLHVERQRPLIFRPRSRSLSSPSRSPIADNNNLAAMNQLFKERFPKAQAQMDERLTNFINEFKSTSTGAYRNRDSQPIVRFVTNQVVEIARDCLHKSHSKQVLNSRYFCEMSENLQRLLVETNEKSPETSPEIARIIKKLILIISRPARLLECLEFDPEEFYKLLEAAEDQAKTHIATDLPIYIITKLGLNRDPLADLQQSSSCEEVKEKDSSRCDKTIPNITSISCLSSDKSGKKTSDKKSTDTSAYCESSSCLTSTPIKGSQNLSATTNVTGPNEHDYEILKLISNGAYGSVHLVKHKQTRQRFALKKINKNNLMLRNQIEQVFIERDILSFTDNPFVVSMYASFETRKHLCLVMEYVEGGDCASLLKNTGPLPSDMARLYFAEMVLAVEYLHSFGVVHRDLKPDNMLITALGHIKLTDFGLSKMGLMSLTTHLYEGFVDINNEARQFSDKQIFGTPEYIAPEVILRQGYGKTIDYWSMGIILYEFLVGCVPFFGETPEELFAHVVNDAIIEFPAEEDWPLEENAKDLISALLQQNPQDRLGSAGPQEVKEHLYLADLDWNSLLRYKAEFIPRLENEEDTSYFDTRADRYNHEFDDTDTDDSPVLASNFASYSPQYRKQYHSRQIYYGSDESNSSINESGKMTPDFRSLNVNPSKGLKMPSTPVDSPFDFSSEINSPDRQGPYFLRNQQIKNVLSTADALEQQNQQRLQKSFKMLNISTPDSSQTDHSSDDVSPKIQRRRKNLIAAAADDASKRHNLPKLSISLEHETTSQAIPSPTQHPKNSHENINKRVLKSASAIDLSLKIMPNYSGASENVRRAKLKLETNFESVKSMKSVAGDNLELDTSLKSLHSSGGGNGSSTASSREVSPSRDGPLINNLKPPIILRRGPRGFGFTVHTIRVYYGDTDYYTMHHTVMAIDEGSPAYEAGLRPGDLITHISGESVQGLYHTQVLQLLLSSQEHVTLRATPLKNTSIQIGGRKREPGQSKMAKKVNARPKKQKSSSDKKRRASLFRRISSKIANAEIQQMASSGALSPIAPSRSLQSFSHKIQDNRPSPRLSLSPLDPFYQQVNLSSQSVCNSSQSSSPSSSVPNTPTSNLNTTVPIYHQRPSSLHGLKHKLHTIGSGGGKSPSSSRRKSVCVIPLSPLARTPSPSPPCQQGPSSPTRSPSPLAFSCHLAHHPAGASNLTQSYTPSQPASANKQNKIQKTNSFKSTDKSLDKPDNKP